MKKTFRVTITFIVALALIVTLLPLTAMAAQDSDPANNKLDSLTVSAGILSPAFSPTGINYTVSLDASTASTNLIATAQSTLATVSASYDGHDYSDNVITVPVALDPGQTSEPLQFFVHPQTGSMKAYTVTVTRAQEGDNNLKTLTATAGTFSPTPFNPSTLSYNLTVPKDISSTTLHATPNTSFSTVKVGVGDTPTFAAFDNVAGQAVTLSNPGATATVKFEVTAQDGIHKQVYTINIKRSTYATLNVTIKDDIGSGNAFDGVSVEVFTDAACTPANSVGHGTTGTTTSGRYTLDSLLAGDYWVKVTAVPSGFILPTLTPTKVTVPEGETKDVTITVPKQGNYTYYGNQLKSIGFSGTGHFTDVFNPTNKKFTIEIDENQTSTRITPVLYDSNAKLYISGKLVTFKDVSFTKMGSSTSFSIKVVPPTGSTLKTATYTLTVRRAKCSNANLTSLATNGPLLVPGFSKGNLNYTLTLANTVPSFKITPKVEGYKASYKILVNSKSVSSTISLKPDEQKIVTVKVTAQNGTTINNYVITATRPASKNAYLKSLTATVGTTAANFDVPFNKTTLKYTLNVPNDQSKVKLVPTKEDTTATYTMTADGVKTNGTFTISAGAKKIVKIDVTAQDGTTVSHYEITVQRAISDNADLSAITVSPSTLSPTFNANQLTYFLNLTYAQATVKITPTKADKMATFIMLASSTTPATTTNGKPVNGTVVSSAASITISLQAGETKYLIIAVTAQDGTPNNYLITIKRAVS